MLKDLYIVITTQDGDSAVAIRHSFEDREDIKALRGEPYLLNRLIQSAEKYIQVKAEINK